MLLNSVRDRFNRLYRSVFNGRIARATFVVRVAILAAVVYATAAPLTTVLVTSSKTLRDAYAAVFVIIFAACLFGFVSAYVKRLHDIGWRGVWAFPLLIGVPFVVIQIGEAYSRYRYSVEEMPDLSGLYDWLFLTAIAMPFIAALVKGQSSENAFGQPPKPIEHIAESRLTLATVGASAVLLVPTLIYVGLFQSGVWVGRGDSAPSMPMIQGNSEGNVFAKCWNFKGVGAGTGKGPLSGIYRDGYAGSVFDFVAFADGSIDIVPGGENFAKPYRADGFNVAAYGLRSTDGIVRVADGKRFLIAAVYDGAGRPDPTVNFTTFAFSRTGEIWPEWQAVMATGLSVSDKSLLAMKEQGRGRLMVGDCIMR